MKKNIFKIIIALVIVLLVCIVAMYLIDCNRMKNGDEVLFSTWGKKYAPPVKKYNDIIEDTVDNTEYSFCGTITIGDRAKLGRRVVLQTTGHEVNYKGRKITADSKGNVCEISTPGFIIVRPEIILADGTKVIPDQTVKRNTKKDEFVYNGRLPE